MDTRNLKLRTIELGTIELARELLTRMEEQYASLEFESLKIQDNMLELEEAIGKLQEAFDI